MPCPTSTVDDNDDWLDQLNSGLDAGDGFPLSVK